MKTLIQNGPVITPFRTIPTGGVLIENGKIAEILERPLAEPPANTTVIDAGGRTISPGFVDIHVHGGGGYGFFTEGPDGIGKICHAHSKYGTTSIVPTTMAAPIDVTCDAISNIRAAAEKGTPGAQILGVHLEGPFFSQAQRGAQAPEYIICPTEENTRELLDAWPGGIRMMGAAPEIDGGLQLGKQLTNSGVVASIAHSDATFEDIERALDYGYSDITHIYSGCSIVHRVNAYRTAGVVEAGLYFDQLTAQVIADGKHLPPSLLRLIYKCKGADRIALISDGMDPAATEMDEGTILTQPNGAQFVYEDGVMKMADRQSFAGSCATMSQLVRNMVQLANVPLMEAVQMASMTPANIIGAKHKGRLSPGCDADVVLFDGDVNVSYVMVQGVEVYRV